MARERGVIVLGGLGIPPFGKEAAIPGGVVDFEGFADTCVNGFDGEAFPPLGKVAATTGEVTGEASSLEGLDNTLLVRRAEFAVGPVLSL